MKKYFITVLGLLSLTAFAEETKRKDLELISEITTSQNYTQLRQDIIFTRFQNPYTEDFDKTLKNIYDYQSMELELFERKTNGGSKGEQDIALSFGKGNQVLNDQTLFESKFTLSNIFKKDYLPDYKLYGHLHFNHDIIPFSTNIEYRASIYKDTFIQTGGLNIEKYWSDYRFLIGKDFSYYHFDTLSSLSLQKGKTNSWKLQASYYEDNFSLNYAYGNAPDLEVVNQQKLINGHHSHTIYSRIFLNKDFHLLAGFNQTKTKTDLMQINGASSSYKTNTLWIGVKTIFK